MSNDPLFRWFRAVFLILVFICFGLTSPGAALAIAGRCVAALLMLALVVMLAGRWIGSIPPSGRHWLADRLPGAVTAARWALHRVRLAAPAVRRPALRAGWIGLLAILPVVAGTWRRGFVDPWWIATIVTALLTVVACGRVTRRLAGYAVSAVIAAGAVLLLVNSFREPSGDFRAWAVAIVAIAASIGTAWFSRRSGSEDSQPDEARRVGAAFGPFVFVVVLAASMALGVSRTGWLPGLLHGCFTPGWHTSRQDFLPAGGTVLRANGDGRTCYGLLDSVEPGLFARSTFGHDEQARALQRILLEKNQPIRRGDRTIVWFGSPNLLADLVAPGRPFVNRSGYLQLTPPNSWYAQDALARLCSDAPGGFDLTVYQQPDPTDHYSNSAVNGVLAEVTRRSATAIAACRKSMKRNTARHATGTVMLTAANCRAGKGRPAPIIFADRWTTFEPFARRINELCGSRGPHRIIAIGSVSRYVADVQRRAISNAPWPLEYYAGGADCGSLTRRPEVVRDLADRITRAALPTALGDSRSFRCAAAPGAAYYTLDAAATVLGSPCEPNALGTFLLPALDAATLAATIELPPPGAGLAKLRHPAASLPDGDRAVVMLPDGNVAKVVEGRLTDPVLPVQLWRVESVADPTVTPVLLPPVSSVSTAGEGEWPAFRRGR